MKKVNKSIIAMLIISTMLGVTACGSTAKQTSDVAESGSVSGTAEEEQAAVGTEEMAEAAEEATAGREEEVDAEAKEEVASGAEEATEEDAEQEETSEGVVYEGIDMESTLPGLEWIETFDGIIDEPKLVVFNDETNKKMIVENGQEVEFCDTDILALFVPTATDKEEYVYPLEDDYTFRKNSVESMNIEIFYDPTSSLNNGDKVDITQRLELDGTDVILTFTLVMKKDM